METAKALELMNGAYSAIGNQVVVPEAGDRLIDAIKTAFTDVERLTKENAKLKESALDPVELAKVAIALQENVTLKKALKLACSDAADPDCPMTESLDLENPVKSCDDCQGECGAECWKRYYIQQVKEQEENSNG